MRLTEIMTRDPEVVGPDALIIEAARKMRDLDVGLLPIVEEGALIGLVTDRDIVVRGIAEGMEPMLKTVREIMTLDIYFCFEDQEVEDAVTVMEDQQVRRLPILDRDHKLVGIVSLGDIAVEVGDEAVTGETLQQISTPSEPNR